MTAIGQPLTGLAVCVPPEPTGTDVFSLTSLVLQLRDRVRLADLRNTELRRGAEEALRHLRVNAVAPAEHALKAALVEPAAPSSFLRGGR